MSSLELHGIEKGYGDVPVFPPITLSVESGEAIGLWGPTGCGKTTLLRVVAGLVVPDSGKLLIGDRVANDPGQRMSPIQRGVGMVFQDLALWPHMSARRHLEYTLGGSTKNRNERRELADQLLARLELSEHAAKRPGAMSRGQRQRVAIARALCNEPPLLLLDEPVSSQDETTAGALLNLFREHKAAGKTMLVATHDREFIRALADRVVVFEHGKVRLAGAQDFG